MEAKSVFASKTFWFNLAYGGLAVVATVTGYFGASDWKPSAEVVEGVVVINSVLNLVLRLWFTKQPVTL